jgi:hypothetical protein
MKQGILPILLSVVALVLAPVFTPDLRAQEFTINPEDVPGDEPDYSPFVDRNIPGRVFWGDTHLHTTNSPDAGLIGNTLGPAEAYRFARGEEVTSSSGLRAKLIRPLDFLVVSDHAEYLGLPVLLRTSDPVLLADPNGKRWHDLFRAGKGYDAFIEILGSVIQRKEAIKSEAVKRTVWERSTEVADRYNEPGRFSAFIGFEWSSMPQGNNLHRVVVFRDGADRANQVLPFSLFDSENPEDLWRYLANYEQQTRGQLLAIPHNGNLSNGLMFAETTTSGAAIDRAYGEARMRWEPIVEVTQIKGDGETHPLLSTEDEFADYETWDKGNLAGTVAKEQWMLKHEYARSALKLGLQLEDQTGVNPYKFGMVGGTDSHTSLATTREENYFGKFSKTEPSPERYKHEVIRSPVGPELTTFSSEESAAGLAAVWARENTRASIFDAMKRKEVYASTGSRILVRVFAGWDFKADEVERPDFADQGYARGVPMGSELTAAPAGASPTFMVRALRDFDGANLDRAQIVKGWLGKDGETHEKVYDVALSDGRKVGADGKVPPVGSTVDVANATYTNTIGDPLLTAHWVDPDFDPNERAFYYLRVIEIPTPRWTAYDAKRFGVTMPDDVPMIVQDRAYTSPIWYTPK